MYPIIISVLLVISHAHVQAYLWKGQSQADILLVAHPFSYTYRGAYIAPSNISITSIRCGLESRYRLPTLPHLLKHVH